MTGESPSSVDDEVVTVEVARKVGGCERRTNLSRTVVVPEPTLL
jgi:hypothetical protein